MVEDYERMRNATMIAEACGGSERQVYNLAKQKQEAGIVALRTIPRGRKPKMSEEDIQQLKAEIKAHPDKTLGELKEDLKLPCSESKLSRIVRKKLGLWGYLPQENRFPGNVRLSSFPVQRVGGQLGKIIKFQVSSIT